MARGWNGVGDRRRNRRFPRGSGAVEEVALCRTYQAVMSMRSPQRTGLEAAELEPGNHGQTVGQAEPGSTLRSRGCASYFPFNVPRLSRWMMPWITTLADIHCPGQILPFRVSDRDLPITTTARFRQVARFNIRDDNRKVLLSVTMIALRIVPGNHFNLAACSSFGYRITGEHPQQLDDHQPFPVQTSRTLPKPLMVSSMGIVLAGSRASGQFCV